MNTVLRTKCTKMLYNCNYYKINEEFRSIIMYFQYLQMCHLYRYNTMDKNYF